MLATNGHEHMVSKLADQLPGVKGYYYREPAAINAVQTKATIQMNIAIMSRSNALTSRCRC